MVKIGLGAAVRIQLRLQLLSSLKLRAGESKSGKSVMC